jgi:cell division protein ZapA
MENTVRVNIAGVEYALKTDESVELTQQLAKEINQKINEVKAENAYVSTNQIAILIALEYGCNCKKAEENTEKLRAEMKNYLEDAASAQSERDFYKRELERLKEDAKARDSQTSLFDTDK